MRAKISLPVFGYPLPSEKTATGELYGQVLIPPHSQEEKKQQEPKSAKIIFGSKTLEMH